MCKKSLNNMDRPNNCWTKLNKRGPKVTQNRRMQGTSVRLSLRYDGLEAQLTDGGNSLLSADAH